MSRKSFVSVIAVSIVAFAMIFAGIIAGDLKANAWSYDLADFEENNVGEAINCSDINSDLRNCWTPSRNAANDTHMSNTTGWNTASVIASGNGSKCAKFVAPQWINSDANYDNGSTVSADLKRGTINGFAGLVINYGGDYTTSLAAANNPSAATQNDYYYKTFEAKTSDMEYALATGLGFTFIPNSNNVVRLFVRTINGVNFDVISYDINLGVDLGAAFHNYEFFESYEGRIYFRVDGVTRAIINYGAPETLTAVPTTYRTLDCTYFRTAIISDKQGNVIASTNKALISPEKTLNWAVCGTGTTIYLDNLKRSSDSTLLDYNGDGDKDTDDAIYLLKNIMNAAKYPIDDDQETDINFDAQFDSADIILLFKHHENPALYPIEFGSDEDNDGCFTVSYQTTSYVNIGGTVKLNASYKLNGGSDLGVTMRSLNTGIATCTADGSVTGVAAGTAKIRATSQNGHYIDFYVTVLPQNLSSAMQLVVNANNSNPYRRYGLSIGYEYDRDIFGSISALQYNDELSINNEFEALGNICGNGGLKSNYGAKDEYITVHYTGNMSERATARANADYFASATNVSIHYVTGNDGVFKVTDPAYVCWHSGDSNAGLLTWTASGVSATSTTQKPTFGVSSNSKFTINGVESRISIPSRSDGIVVTGDTFYYDYSYRRSITQLGIPWKVVNGQYYLGTTWWCSTQQWGGVICGGGGTYNSIGIESCVNPDSDLWYTWHKTAQLVARLLVDYNLDTTRITGHNMWSGKDCPQPFLANDLELWDVFLRMCQCEYDKLVACNGYTFTMRVIEGSDICPDSPRPYVESGAYSLTLYPGRVLPDNRPHIILYEVTATKNGVTESIKLACAVNKR